MLRSRADASGASEPPGRYTLSGANADEARVAQDLSRLATGIDSELGERLRALWLTGPIARGEGGIVELDGEPCVAAPGYQLLAVLKRRPERYARTLDAIAATWSRLLRAQVAIRPLGLPDLAGAGATRFWFHAGRGQVLTLVGMPAAVAPFPRLEAQDLPPLEAARALCEGLTALALDVLEPARSLGARLFATQCAVLGCCDALLLFRGQYRASLLERGQALANAHASAALRAAHADAVTCAARPDRFLPERERCEAWIAVTRRSLGLWLLDHEAARVGATRELAAYVAHPSPLLEGVESERARPWLRPVRAWARTPERRFTPLERLLRAAAALAFGSSDRRCRSAAAAWLGHPVAEAGALLDATLAAELRALAAEALPQTLDSPFHAPGL